MEAEAAGLRLLEQAGVEQRLQVAFRDVQWDRGEGGGGVRIGLRPGVATQAPEKSVQIRVETAVRQGDGGHHVVVGRGQEAGASRAVAESGGQVRDRPAGPIAEPGRGDTDGERQVAAQGDDFGDRIRLGLGPPVAENASEERDGVVVRQDVERQRGRGLQRGHPVPARGQDQRRRRSREEGKDVGGVQGVVEEEDGAPAGEQRAPQGTATLERCGDAVRRNSGVSQQRLQRLGRCQRGVGETEAVEVDVVLAVGESVGQSVGEMDGERRLADASHAVDREDARQVHGRGPCDFLVPAGEVERRVGEEVRRLRRLAFALQRRVLSGLAEDPRLRPAQLDTGVQAQLLVQQPAPLLEDAEGVRSPSGVMERGHEAGAQRLPERMLGDQGPEFRHQCPGVPGLALQPQRDEPLHGPEPLLVERRRRVRQPLSGHPRQRRPPPHPHRSLKQPDRPTPIPRHDRPLSLPHQPPEPMEVDQLLRHLDAITPRRRDNGDLTPRPTQLTPQQPHDVVHLLPRRNRRALPQRVDEPLRRHHLIGPQQQAREQLAHPLSAQRHPPPTEPHLQRPEHVEPRTPTVHRPLPTASAPGAVIIKGLCDGWAWDSTRVK
ncbi:hypothetical protein GCM10009838_63310 [Catenulispora subtropica]|uniref:Uncharacterized protein n=1 Tax=Catenulispora subtropica TaxID=450798 RepID=A0ABP5E704_9ACTN